MNRLVVARMIILLVLTGVVLLVTLLVITGPSSFWQVQLASVFSSRNDQDLLTVAFLDIGQGDAIFIETPDGVQVLIDGGPDASVLRELPRIMPWWDRSLDLVLATHSDKDHIGGLVDVFTRYQVGATVRTENVSETVAASAFGLVSAEEQAPVYTARAGDMIALGASTSLRVLSPGSDPQEWESNASSIVAQLVYGEIEFMLTGDATLGIEEYLVRAHGESLASEVLKLGHHGSRTSTAEEFLRAVAPEYAVVSAGADNRYGHPHVEVIEKVERFGSQIVSTAELGTIVFKSDGQRVWLEQAK